VGRITPIRFRDFERVLKEAGCEFVRQRGSHRVYTRSDLKRPLVVPRYKAIPVFIIKNNLRILGLSDDEYLAILNRLSQ